MCALVWCEEQERLSQQIYDLLRLMLDADVMQDRIQLQLLLFGRGSKKYLHPARARRWQTLISSYADALAAYSQSPRCKVTFGQAERQKRLLVKFYQRDCSELTQWWQLYHQCVICILGERTNSWYREHSSYSQALSWARLISNRISHSLIDNRILELCREDLR